MNTKFLTPRTGAVAGLCGSIAFSVLWVMAVIADGHWVLGSMTLSELGDRSRNGSIYFNSGVILMGLLSVVFAKGLHDALSRGAMGRLGTWLLGAAGVVLIGVGVFPIDTGLPHTIVSYAFFSLAAISLALLVVPLWRSHIFHRWGGALTALLLAVCFLSIPFLTVAGVEALAVGCLLLWTFLISARMLAHHPAP